MSERYPAITRACIEISYDNGGVNRTRSEKQVRRELSAFLDRWPPGSEHLSAIEAWLAKQSKEAISTICCGEYSEQQTALKDAPPFTDQLLNNYFDEVC